MAWATSPYLRACALSCPSLAIYGPGSFGISAFIMPLAALFPFFPIFPSAAFALRPSFASVARDLGWCEYDYPRWGAHTTTQRTATPPVLGAPASIMGRSSHGGYVRGLRPFALPRPDALSPPPSRSLVCADTTNNARRYGHPLTGDPGPIGVGAMGCYHARVE
jgi:hypothetical protein